MPKSKGDRMWGMCALLCVGLVGALQQEQVAQHAIKLHRGKGAAVTQGRRWLAEHCRRLAGLLRQKTVAVKKLGVAIAAVERDHTLSDPEKLFQVHTLEIFQKELNESEKSVFQAVLGLQRALQGDYRDVVNMKESSRQRLEALREAAIKVRKGQTGMYLDSLEGVLKLPWRWSQCHRDSFGSWCWRERWNREMSVRLGPKHKL